jgi:hypothetical protein
MLEMALTGILLPALCSGLLLLFSSYLFAQRALTTEASNPDLEGKDGPSGFVREVFIGPILGLAYMVTHWVLVGRPAVPWLEQAPAAIDAKHWIFWSVGLGVLGVLIGESRRAASQQRILRWLVRVGVLGVLVGGTLLSQFMNTWSVSRSLFMGLGCGLLCMAHFWSWDGLFSRSRQGAWNPFIFMIIGSGMAGSVMLGGSASLAQLLGVLTSAVGAFWVLVLLGRFRGFGEGASTILGTAMPGLLLNAYIYASFPLLNTSLLLLSCHGLWLGLIPRIKEKHPRLALVAAILPTLLLLGMVLGRVYMSYEQPYEYEGF